MNNFNSFMDKGKPDNTLSLATGGAESVDFKIDTIKAAFYKYKKEIDDMLDVAEQHKISDEESNQTAVVMLSQATNIKKAIEEQRKDAVKPHNEFRTKVNGLAKMFTEPLDKIDDLLRSKTEDYAHKKLIEKRKNEKAAAEKRRKLQEELDLAAEEGGVESVKLVEPVVKEEKGGIIRTEDGASLSVTMIWKGFIIDSDKVPREYCIPDQKLIDEAVKAGVREIPGVEIKEVPQSRLRT